MQQYPVRQLLIGLVVEFHALITFYALRGFFLFFKTILAYRTPFFHATESTEEQFQFAGLSTNSRTNI